jgi:hypothetical protein
MAYANYHGVNSWEQYFALAKELKEKKKAEEEARAQALVGMSATQPNKATNWEEGADVHVDGEKPGWYEEAAKRVREKEAAEAKRKKAKELEAKMERERKIAAEARRKKDLERKALDEEWEKVKYLNELKVQRERLQFHHKVLREARLAREKEADEDQERKRKGKGPCATQ